MTSAAGIEVRRLVRATPARVFAAWTESSQICAWWGPVGVTCPAAEVDLRVGGTYRIGNQLPDGMVVWATGRFQRVDPPHELIYTWRFDPGPEIESLVTVRFEAVEDGTEIVLRHEGILDQSIRDEHARGWHGCLDGLVTYLSSAEPPAG